VFIDDQTIVSALNQYKQNAAKVSNKINPDAYALGSNDDFAMAIRSFGF